MQEVVHELGTEPSCPSERGTAGITLLAFKDLLQAVDPIPSWCGVLVAGKCETGPRSPKVGDGAMSVIQRLQ